MVTRDDLAVATLLSPPRASIDEATVERFFDAISGPRKLRPRLSTSISRPGRKSSADRYEALRL
ncbi:MAG TPA: hypothetical protein VJX67_17570 [Blastocatellia bacterium]|nr:hypothetical protein [Blastocatellia bacterium]